MKILIGYDIFDNKRRRKVAKYLYGYSHTYQKSALEMDINKAELKEIVEFLKKNTKEKDLVSIYKVKNHINIGKSKEVDFVI